MILRLAATLPILFWSSAAWACVDLTFDLGPGLVDPRTAREQMLADNTLFMLRGLTDLSRPLVVEGQRAVVPCDGVAEPWRNDLRTLAQESGVADNAKLRAIYHRAYPQTIAFRGQDDYVLPTIAELREKTGYRSWDRRVVRRSMVKRKTRVIYRSPADFPYELSVSETRDSEAGDLTAAVLETEIAVLRRDGSGDWDFYTYDGSGKLSSVGLFPVGERPSPEVCLACHYNGQERRYDQFLRRTPRN